jgi:adenylate cyclase
MARLVITGPDGQMERDLQPFNSLGRHPDNSIQLLDRIVSKQHCLVELRGTQWVLRDLGSLNGTYINDQRVQGEQALHHGDQIALGNTRVLFHDAAPVGAVAGYAPAAPAARPPRRWPRASTPRCLRAPPSAPQGPGRPMFEPRPPAPPAYAEVTAGIPPAPLVHPAAPPPPPPPTVAQGPAATGRPQGLQALRNVTIGGTMMESHVRTKIAAELQQFLPERSVGDVEVLRRDYEKLRISYELQRAVGAELDLDRLLEKILERSFDLISADRGVILLFDEGELKARCSRARRPGPEELVVSQTVVNQVVKEKVAVLSSDAKLDPRFSESKSIIMTGIRSSMAVPLLHKQELLGIMMVDSQNPNAFGEKDLQLFTNIANQAALNIANAALAQRIEREALARARFQRLLSPSIAELVVSGQGGGEAGRRAAHHHDALLRHPGLHLPQRRRCPPSRSSRCSTTTSSGWWRSSFATRARSTSLSATRSWPSSARR